MFKKAPVPAAEKEPKHVRTNRELKKTNTGLHEQVGKLKERLQTQQRSHDAVLEVHNRRYKCTRSTRSIGQGLDI